MEDNKSLVIRPKRHSKMKIINDKNSSCKMDKIFEISNHTYSHLYDIEFSYEKRK